MLRGQVYKAVAGMFTVKTENGEYSCSARKKVKNDIDIFVGDYVDIDEGDKTIERVYSRNNIMIRPYVSNIDLLIIVVAPQPEPDWTLVEKLIINCYAQNITPAIIINKVDLMTEAKIKEYEEPYKELAVLKVSAATEEGMDNLAKFIQGKLVCFAGQSAVGKTSIINALAKTELEVGELSRKIMRGKNTTRQVEIIDVGANIRVVDTCGFSILKTENIEYDRLASYYDDYVKVTAQCKYDNCSHTTEPECAVRRLVGEGKLNAVRYNRYVALYNEMKELWRKKYE